jgi:hypothetical protein
MLCYDKGMDKLTVFKHDNKRLNVKYIETQNVKDGVICDVYDFVQDSTCDLGLVSVKAGSKTPMQKMLSGYKTIERFMAGEGLLYLKKLDGEEITYVFPRDQPEVEVNVGDIMQWTAISDLSFYEICYPKYENGRFQDLD